MANFNIILIVAASVLALVAVYVLYSIMMFQGNKNSMGSELQLSTKNILEQVEVLFEKGEYALVILLASKYLDRVPNHREVRQFLAQAYYKDKKYNNAIKQCIIILKKNSGDVNTRKLLADCYLKKEYLAKALKEYETVFEYRSNDIEVVRTLAELYRNTEQLYSSISVYNILVGLLEQNDEMAEVQRILAELNEEAHDYPAAFEAYKSRLSIYPTDVMTNQKLVELYIKIKNYPKAIETLLYMLTFVTEPKPLLWVYDKLIELYVETEEYEKAIDYSNKMLEVQGVDTFRVKNNIASYYINLKNFDTGISIFEELVMLSQNNYDVTLELANAYIVRKDYQKALDKYLALLDKATQKEAKNVHLLICELYIIWAAELSEANKIAESFTKLESAIEYNAINPEIYYYKAMNNMKTANYSTAIELLQIALEYDKSKSEHVKYYLTVSEAHHNLGNFFEEKKALNDLLKIDPKNPMGLYKTGLMYASQHNIKNAEESFKQALQYDPELIPAKYNLALIYESNNRDRAKELLIEILEQEPNHLEAKNALTNINSSDY